MSGNKKLAQSIAVAGMTGVLAFTATFSQPQIVQTNGTIQLAKNGTAGVIAAFAQYEQMDETWAVTIEKDEIVKAASVDASVITKKNESKAVKTGSSAADTAAVSEETAEEKADTAEITDTAENKEKEQKAELSVKPAEEKQEIRTVSKAVKEIKETADRTADEEKDSVAKAAEKFLTDNGNEETKESPVDETVKETEDSLNEETAADKEETEIGEEPTEESPEDTEMSETETETKAAAETEEIASRTLASRTIASKTAKASETEEAKADAGASSTKKKWAKKLMADVEDFLYIRESGSEDAKIVGKLYKGDVATVEKKGKVWTKISSGSVEGFVKNEYCVYGTKAYKLAKKICDVCATVKTDGLRIRDAASEDAPVLSVAAKGDKLTVDTDAKRKKGWVAVTVDGADGYVSAEYVTVGLNVGKAISIEEEQQQIAAKQKAEQEAAAETDTVTSYEMTPVATSGDLTLLSAIIYCEAGGESYAGQVAVGAVVMNRVKSSDFPNTISGVVYQSGQFSPVANGALARALSNGSYKHCIAAAQEALAGADNTNGAKFFHRAGSGSGLVIGHHIFY